MSRVFITGSTDGLGLAAARQLIDEGHAVVLHARSRQRASAFGELAQRCAGIVIGDLASAAETRGIADAVNALGQMDAVIHNAGVYVGQRGRTPERHSTTLAVNILAPYLLTALIRRPRRLVYLSSGMHRGGDPALRDIDWNTRRWSQSQAYSDSKLYVTALALAVARHWPDVLSNAVDPGWVPTRMGGAGAPDDLQAGRETQAWLATSDEAAARTTGGYWYQRQRQVPAATATDAAFQDRLLATLTALTGAKLLMNGAS